MTELLTAAQMRAIEQAAIASGEVTGLELMERAGRGVVEAIFEEWPELRDEVEKDGGAAPEPPEYFGKEETGARQAVVLCGPGNNGGDGFVVARLLRERGWEVEVFLYGDPEKLPPDARVNYERWRGMGEVSELYVLNDTVDARPGMGFDLIVDALFGIGLRQSLPDEVAGVFCNLFRGYLNGHLVCVDTPSGLCADSGRPLVPEGYSAKGWPALDGLVGEASLTVTFHRRKLGHVLGVGPRYCRRTIVKDIGLARQNDWLAVRDLTDRYAGASSSVSKWDEHHKYSHGHALILSGPPGHTGAARLAARGALRIGAGLVTVGAMAEVIPEHAAQVTAIMLRAVADGGDLTDALADPRITALCLGPALGTDGRARGLVAAALGLTPDGPPPPSPPHEGEGRHPDRKPAPSGDTAGAEALPLPLVGRGAPRPTVLDADALTLLARDPALFAALHENCILTPHAGEFARLFPDIAEKLAAPATKGPAYSKVDATREAAKRAGCVVLYKGPDTVIADPSGRCSINSAHYDRAAPWLATAGSGDVLAGFITGLLARGFDPMRAAETAAWLHVECARKFGPGLIAEDLPEQLPAVFRDLGL